MVKIRQSYIVGVALIMAALGTLAVSIVFCQFTSYQLIGVSAFELDFRFAQHLKLDYFHGSNGFRFLKPVPMHEFDVPSIAPSVEGAGGSRDAQTTGGQPGSPGGQPAPHGGQPAQNRGQPTHPISSPGQPTHSMPHRDRTDLDDAGGHLDESMTGHDPSAPAHDQSGRPDEDYEDEADPNTFALYLGAINSSILVQNPKFGAEPWVKCFILRFWHAAIFAIVASLAQILVSIAYIFWREKSIKSMSAFFYSYFFVFLTHLACLCVVLNGKPNRRYAEFSAHNYSRVKGDIFAAILGLNCLVLIGLTTLTCVTCNTEEYSDRCIDQDTCNRKRSLSTAHILSATASTDRLNN